MLDINVAEQLFPNPLTIVIQLISTSILLYFLFKYLWKPAKEFMAKRMDAMQRDLEQAKEDKIAAHQLLKQANEEVSNAYHKSQTIIASANKEASVMKEEILNQAKVESMDMKKRAYQEMEMEKASMKQEIADEIVQVAMYATEKLLKEKIDEEKDQEAIQQFIRDIQHEAGS